MEAMLLRPGEPAQRVRQMTARDLIHYYAHIIFISCAFSIFVTPSRCLCRSHGEMLLYTSASREVAPGRSTFEVGGSG